MVRQFKISMAGYKSNLTIKSNDKFITLFFMIEGKVYEYYIYLPDCQNKEYIILNILNENKSNEDKEKLSNLFLVETNKYYFQIMNESTEYGNFQLNGEFIYKNRLNILDSNNYILDFIRNDKEITRERNITLSYYVSVEYEEAYSKTCEIKLILKTCYKSCKKCTVDSNKSNETQHNCIECMSDYYKFPENPGNCYSKSEKKINWYFDNGNSIFGLCNEKCISCSSRDNCIYCSNGLYLYNGDCLEECPSGYFPKSEQVEQNTYYICEKCYQNCKNCSEKGISEEMKCDTCKEGHIKYNNNCYKIENSFIKSFSEPESSKLGSCYEKFQLYIKEDSNECIPLPNEIEGYYVSNEITGLLSKCHDNCLSCKNHAIQGVGDIKSMECIKCKDSNSPDKTMIQVDNNCFKIIQYNESKIFFNISEIEPNSNHIGTCLHFGKAILFGEYECIDKPNNSYYVLNNDENTGVIKNCQEFCNNCPNENINCLECPKECVKSKEIEINVEKNDSVRIESNECKSESFDKGKSIDELKEIIKSNINSYIGLCKVFNGSNFLASVISSSKITPEEQIKKGISAFDLGNCSNVLKEHHNIPEEENLLVLNMETRNDENDKLESNSDNDESFKIGKHTELEIYDYSGRKLNLSVCKDDIKIMKYIGDIEEIDINSAETLSEQGIDVFNASDKFFNDICHPYDNLDGKDIILSDRRNDIYKNVTFCQDGCTYKGMNYTLKAANCLCDSNSLEGKTDNNTNIKKESDGIDFNELKKSFIENLFNFNFDVVKCYNLIINVKNLVHNIGFLCLASMFLLQIIFFFIYLIKKLKPLKYFLLIFKSREHIVDNTNSNIMNNKKKNNNIYHRKKTKKKINANPPLKYNYFSKIFSNKNQNKRDKYIKNKSGMNADNKIDCKDDIIYKIKEPKKANPEKI